MYEILLPLSLAEIQCTVLVDPCWRSIPHWLWLMLFVKKKRKKKKNCQSFSRKMFVPGVEQP